jgi:hypothetical protein
VTIHAESMGASPETLAYVLPSEPQLPLVNVHVESAGWCRAAASCDGKARTLLDVAPFTAIVAESECAGMTDDVPPPHATSAKTQPRTRASEEAHDGMKDISRILRASPAIALSQRKRAPQTTRVTLSRAATPVVPAPQRRM